MKESKKFNISLLIIMVFAISIAITSKAVGSKPAIASDFYKGKAYTASNLETVLNNQNTAGYRYLKGGGGEVILQKTGVAGDSYVVKVRTTQTAVDFVNTEINPLYDSGYTFLDKIDTNIYIMFKPGS